MNDLKTHFQFGSEQRQEADLNETMENEQDARGPAWSAPSSVTLKSGSQFGLIQLVTRACWLYGVLAAPESPDLYSPLYYLSPL